MNAKEHNIFEQFNGLLQSNIPDEYKDILQNFQQQGAFYQQLLQNIESGDDLSSFWELPNSLGFSINQQAQAEWLRSTFDTNDLQNPSISAQANSFDPFIKAFPQIKGALETLHVKITDMTNFHSELSQLAMQKFQVLHDEGDDLSNEQHCVNWLKAGEDAFAEVSQRDDYIQTQNELIETLGEIKNSQSTLIEQLSKTWGLPSQQSLQDLQKGLHQLRIEFAEYKEKTETTINQLKTTVRKLS